VDRAHQCGFSFRQIRDRVARGDWRSVFGPVLGSNELNLSPGLLDRAAHLAVAERVIAGPSAAPFHRLVVPRTAAAPVLIVPRRTTCRVGSVHLIVAQLDRRDVVPIDGALVTSAARTVLDCLCLLPEADGLDLLERALQRGVLSLTDLSERARHHAGRRGAPKLARLIRTAAGGTRFAAERQLVRLLHRSGLVGWAANMPIRVGDRVVAIGDVVFEAPRLVVEVDGLAFHVTPERFQRDRTRQNLLVTAGWKVLRFTWRDLAERPTYVIGTIRRQLAEDY
jgi:very-short-patch-repair endonuclease